VKKINMKQLVIRIKLKAHFFREPSIDASYQVSVHLS
jgi:hypothetical protein